ncbi:MAG: hypothetical protein LC128_10015 [Chitinophagales bacterium]|nr:hypothetical protein [Chitinophagales bacterium]
MKTGIIILCRFNSSRLPGKILKEINGKYIIDYIVERLEVVVPRSRIVIATSNELTDDPIADYCRSHDLGCFRGSLDDVAGRFIVCAKANGFEFVFRINGDNIFVDADLVNEAIQLANTGKYEFISNVHNRTFPKGMSIEGVKVELFEKCLPLFNSYQREHVMPYFYDNTDQVSHYYIYNETTPELAGFQLAIDTQKDLELAEKIISKFRGPHTNYGLREISTIIKEL